MSDPGDRIDVDDEQGEAEALDDDVLGGAEVPPDEPYGLPELLGRDTTTAGEDVPDSVAEPRRPGGARRPRRRRIGRPGR